MSKTLKNLALNYTRAKFSYFAESESKERFDEWLSRFTADKDSIPPPPSDAIPSSDHDAGIAARWFADDIYVYGVTESGEAYRIPVAESDKVPEVSFLAA